MNPETLADKLVFDALTILRAVKKTSAWRPYEHKQVRIRLAAAIELLS